jgi:hypothetical protein
MRYVPLEVLKERISHKYDADALVDILGIDVDALLEAFEDKLIEHRDLFLELEDLVDDD